MLVSKLEQNNFDCVDLPLSLNSRAKHIEYGQAHLRQRFERPIFLVFPDTT
jgi:hypothetical protein